MTVVKISKKSELDALVSKLTIRLERKPTQQEVNDTCVDLGNEYFEEVVGRLNTYPILDDAKMQRIEKDIEETKDVPWIPAKKSKFLSRNDADIYGT